MSQFITHDLGRVDAVAAIGKISPENSVDKIRAEAHQASVSPVAKSIPAQDIADFNAWVYGPEGRASFEYSTVNNSPALPGGEATEVPRCVTAAEKIEASLRSQRYWSDDSP